jgi:DNA-binding transcriptional LysR family regulator
MAMVLLTKFSRYFQEVIHHGSIRKAAEHLHIAASAVDRQILNVEETLGVRLFDRVSGGVRLTAAGEAVFSPAHPLGQGGSRPAPPSGRTEKRTRGRSPHCRGRWSGRQLYSLRDHAFA